MVTVNHFSALHTISFIGTDLFGYVTPDGNNALGVAESGACGSNTRTLGLPCC